MIRNNSCTCVLVLVCMSMCRREKRRRCYVFNRKCPVLHKTEMIRAQHSKRIDKRNDVDLTKKQRKARENQRQKKKCIQIKERREKSLYIASTSVIKYRRET